MRTLIQKSFKAALDANDILISPAAPSAAYKIGMFGLLVLTLCTWWSLFKSKYLITLIFAGEKKNDPLAMYAGDIMTVSNFCLSIFFLPNCTLLPLLFCLNGCSRLDFWPLTIMSLVKDWPRKIEKVYFWFETERLRDLNLTLKSWFCK